MAVRAPDGMPTNQQGVEVTNTDAADVVRLIITQLDTSQATPAPRIIRKVETTSTGLVDAAAACARELVVSEHLGRLLGSIERTFSTTPESGYAAIINRPSELMLVALWPWAPVRADAV